ncbi:MAG: formylglycine-generating enzyme family protein, partial [Nitrospira sp.]|nr:formylglycine-generating enzyme family protein [Nitrospira sp.]
GFLSRAENGLKLPTEAQWEYACRAGTKTRFYTGDSDADLALAGWCTIAEAIQPVGRKHPNAFGLYDMHGNMWEWCADWYGAYADGAVKNPTGPATGELRVLRSGSWDHGPRSCRAARRNYSTPTGRDDCRGFRVVVVASSQTP